MSRSNKRMKLKHKMKEISAEEGMSIIQEPNPKVVDLPEPILIKIFSYLNHKSLIHVSQVCMDWKTLAHTQVLWLQATIRFDCFRSLVNDIPDMEEYIRAFIQDILATPYLDHLYVSFKHCPKDAISSVMAALLATCCRIRKLTYVIDHYGPETALFLQQHPELQELQLQDSASKDDKFSAGVAAAVGSLAPYLNTLVLSYSRILHMPKAGLLFSSPTLKHREQHNLNQAKFRMRFPRQALDLRNVEDSHQHTVDTEDQPQGLLHLELCYEDMHYEDPRSNEPSWATATKNASALLHAHKHTLKSAHVDYTSQDVWRALGECKKLEKLLVDYDRNFSSFSAMLQAMQPNNLHHVEVTLPNDMDAMELAGVLRTLSQYAPRVETLALTSHSPICFPGFGPMQDMLVGKGGRAKLKELILKDLGPVGRAQILELASIATANAGLSLRRLGLYDTMCSLNHSPTECRNRVKQTVTAAMPTLEIGGLEKNCPYCRKNTTSFSLSDSDDSDW